MAQKASIALLTCLAVALVALLVMDGNGGDAAVLKAMIAYALAHPQLGQAAVLVTQMGGAPALLGMTTLAAAWLIARRRSSPAVFVAGTIISGRLAVDLLKLIVERSRPQYSPFPVDVTSFSFPSGHAANSMITLLTIALVVTPPAQRPMAVAAAIVVSLAIGLTRPLLGVHWPSDVIAGWAFGIAWVAACQALVIRRDGKAA